MAFRALSAFALFRMEFHLLHSYIHTLTHIHIDTTWATSWFEVSTTADGNQMATKTQTTDGTNTHNENACHSHEREKRANEMFGWPSIESCYFVVNCFVLSIATICKAGHLAAFVKNQILLPECMQKRTLAKLVHSLYSRRNHLQTSSASSIARSS